VRFLVWDALQLPSLGEQVDTILDSGLFHVFSDEDRSRYVQSLKSALPDGARYHMLCFSDRQPGGFGPRRVTQDEIRSSFGEGWRVDEIRPARLDINIDPNGALAWQVAITRTATS
jgi:cyclopropane fatty-acyl-phospholipid synthase-like methyltransferase